MVNVSVGVPTGYNLDRRDIEVRFPAEARDFLFSTASAPTTKLFPIGTEGGYLGGKATGACS
jgi:hypothetical protein